ASPSTSSTSRTTRRTPARSARSGAAWSAPTIRPWPASASTASGTTPPWWKSRGSPSCSWSGGAAHSRLPGGFHVGVGLVGQGVPQGEEQVGGAGAVPVLREHLGGQAGVEERQPAPDGEGADVVDERLRVGSGALP